jgi:hypothetical protein
MTIAVIGDYGCLASTCLSNATQQEPQVASLVHSWSPDAIFTVGDNSYENGTTAEIQAAQQPYAQDITAGRFYPVAGIHDWGQQCADSTYIQRSTSYFGRPAHYAAHLGSGLLDYFATDMNCADRDGDTAGSIQANQYLSDLSASTSTWRISGGHAPFYSSGYFGSQQYTHWAIVPQVDLFLSGHDHDMEHMVEGGQNFVVEGTSGEEFKPLGAPIAGSLWSDGGHFGAVRLTVTQTSLTVDFVTLGNVVLHSFTVTKGASTAGTVSGTVVDSGTGQPVSGATVSYAWGRAATTSAGPYTLNNVPAGTYAFTAAAPGYTSVAQTVGVAAGGTYNIGFRLAASARISVVGQVTDAGSGKAVAGAGVSFSGGSATTDTSGNYSIGNVSPGSYQLAASASGYQNQTRTMTVGPAYVQGALANAGSGSGSGATSVSVSLANPVSINDRVVVGVRVDSSPSGAVVQAVSDSAGNVYTKHVAAANARPSGYQAEVTIWSAVLSLGAGTKLTVTATSSASADISIGAAEYSGLSTVSGAGAVDQVAAGGAVATSGPASGPTPAATNSNELAVGVYGDGGSGVLITAGAGWNQRFNNSANNQGTIALEDQPVANSGATPNSQWSNASPNSWAVAEAVFKATPTSTQNFSLNTAPNVTGNVKSAVTGQALAAATVSFSGNQTTTDQAGNYGFSNVASGTYSLTSALSGYVSQTATITVSPGTATAQNFSLNTVAAAPAYVQGALANAGSGSGSGAASVSVSLPNPVAANDRLVVGVRVDSNPNAAVVQAVSDSAGNVYTKHVTATNNRPAGFQAEVTVWSAVVSAGAGSRVTVTATSTGSADISIGAAEYSGLSTLSGAGAVDQVAAGGAVAASGPASGPTPATTSGNDLAVGFYGDGGSGVLITASAGWTQRFNNSANNQGTIALADQLMVNTGSTSNSQWGNASPNSWAVAEVVFKAP